MGHSAGLIYRTMENKSNAITLIIDCEKYTLAKHGMSLYLNDNPVSGEIKSNGESGNKFVVDFAGHDCPNISTDTVLKKLIGAYFLCILFDTPVIPCEVCHNLITIGGVEKKLPPTAMDSLLFDFVALIQAP